ncbi:MAG: COG3942 and LysM peptidoglycan-binding domain-containing protein [Patescibacteria group bacterium]
MLKILVPLKQKLKEVLIWLWKTFFYLIFSLYLSVKKISPKNLVNLNYSLCLTTTVLLIILAMAESGWAIQNENPTQQIFLAKFNKQKVETIVEEINFNQEDKQEEKKPDFIIASTRNDQENIVYPSTAMGGAALVGSDLITNEMPIMRTEIETYIVQPGDTLESIAKKFNISVETICWENKLSSGAVLKVGQELKILPVSGLTHKVLAGDTLDALAQKYKTSIEDIIDFNNLADPSDIFVGDVLIIPFGKKPPAPKPKPTSPARTKVLFVNENYSNYKLWLKNTQCRRFVYGQCTSWVAFKWATKLGRCIPWTGHAKSWLSSAKIADFKIGSRSDGPQIGAIVVLKESGWAAQRYGHVGYVESFDEATITFSEMNFNGPWVISTRSYPKDSSHILGYIYPN